jgi:hypothetical protein
MKTEPQTPTALCVASPLAAEDLRRGDYVSILYEIVEYPSFFWSCDPQLLTPGEPVAIRRLPSDCGTPLKVKAICLPFVFVKLPSGEHRTLDVRQHRLVRLSRSYARQVCKVLGKTAACGDLA